MLSKGVATPRAGGRGSFQTPLCTRLPAIIAPVSRGKLLHWPPPSTARSAGSDARHELARVAGVRNASLGVGFDDSHYRFLTRSAGGDTGASPEVAQSGRAREGRPFRRSKSWAPLERRTGKTS